MTNLSRFVACCLVAVFTRSAGAADEDRPASATPAEALAQRYGLAAWPTVEQLDFVFRVELAEGRVIERAWVWQPIDRTVTAKAGTADAVTFSLDDITEDNREHHAHFINDTYWLLFPFQLVWSTCDVAEAGEADAPISGEPSRKLVVTYPAEGGYTPGDAYDLYLDPDTGLIREWVFRRGNGEDGRPATWDSHQQLGPLLISADHHGPDGSGFRLSFPHIEVTFTDGEVASATLD